ncbi:hypothetical protein [Vreelandella alkaliphila]|uniref:Uncharacterized protein n=1 Tax=Vreelandella alkaliphila TaxID=272774 RepID=A0AAJ2S2F7_9GAMM|nr:hypothetical protein [Halomonas alkaliphila]MDX5979567.1 hypothetical protein [Halomonas alkaliphila]
MPSAPIHINWGDVDAQSKQGRPDRSVTLHLRALGLLEVDGVPVPERLFVPPVEPGSVLEVVVQGGGMMLEERDVQMPMLITGPLLLVCDSAGSEGEVAVVVLTNAQPQRGAGAV